MLDRRSLTVLVVIGCTAVELVARTVKDTEVSIRAVRGTLNRLITHTYTAERLPQQSTSSASDYARREKLLDH